MHKTKGKRLIRKRDALPVYRTGRALRGEVS